MGLPAPPDVSYAKAKGVVSSKMCRKPTELSHKAPFNAETSRTGKQALKMFLAGYGSMA